MAVCFFFLTDKLSLLVGLALEHQQLDSSDQDACEHIPAQPIILCYNLIVLCSRHVVK